MPLLLAAILAPLIFEICLWLWRRSRPGEAVAAAEAAAADLSQDIIYPTLRNGLVNSLKHQARDSAAGARLSALHLEFAVACAYRLHLLQGGRSTPQDYRREMSRRFRDMIAKAVAQYGPFIATNDMDAGEIVDRGLAALGLRM